MPHKPGRLADRKAGESNPPAEKDWLSRWMKTEGISLWGVADLKGFSTPPGPEGSPFPRAVSWVVPMNPDIMASVTDGPNPAYADEYARVNQRINDLAGRLSRDIAACGAHALPLAASERTDPVGIRGDFPQKTAATRAGLGWIGRHCQLITRPFGSWVRLGCVFTTLAVATATPLERHFCGSCRRCVDACPAGALQGGAWRPGIPREAILDATVCDRWKKTNYYQFHNGHNCGICSAVCPFGTASARRSNRVKTP